MGRYFYLVQHETGLLVPLPYALQSQHQRDTVVIVFSRGGVELLFARLR